MKKRSDSQRRAIFAKLKKGKPLSSQVRGSYSSESALTRTFSNTIDKISSGDLPDDALKVVQDKALKAGWSWNRVSQIQKQASFRTKAWKNTWENQKKEKEEETPEEKTARILKKLKMEPQDKRLTVSLVAGSETKNPSMEMALKNALLKKYPKLSSVFPGKS